MRGRGNNNNSGNNNNGNQNRRGPNPLTRSYESNGPDVKIRGTAQQVAEKYTTLARDAHSAGDRVMAENYLQHAEHYNRVIAAAMAQQALQQPSRDGQDDSDGDDDSIELPRQVETGQHQPQHGHERQPHAQQPSPEPQGFGPQPVIEGLPAEVVHAEGGMNGEANGADEHGGVNGQSVGEAAPRRARRRRPLRARGEQGADEGGEAAPASEGEPV